MPTVEKVSEGFFLGEGPHWDISSQTLYFVDIFGTSIARFNPATKKTTKVKLDNAASFIIPVEGRKDQLVIPLKDDLVIISWNGEDDKISIIEKLGNVAPRTFNDAKCDASGRLWVGVHSIDRENFRNSKPLGALCVFEQKKFQEKVDKIRVANGLAFNEQKNVFFYIDTLTGGVDRFDFDVNTGNLSNRQVWFTLERHDIPGLPDGMTIDTDGNLWVAVFGGGRVLKVDGSKKETLLDTIHLPADQVTSVAFGGANLDELFVTTGAVDMDPNVKIRKDNGATYRVTGTGSKGFPAHSFRLK